MKKMSYSIYLVILSFLFNNVCFSQTNQYEDPYLWLEEINGKKTIEWVKKQNSISANKIEEFPLFDSIKKRVLESFNDVDKIAYPSIVGEYVYNLWKDEKNQRGVWRRMLIVDFINNKSNWEVVLDIDKLSEKENKKWVYKGVEWLKEKNEICLLYLSDGGSDKNYMREFNTKSKEFVSDGFIHEESKDGANWIDENTILIYRDFGEGTLTTSGFARTVKKWKRGEEIENAEIIFEIDSTNLKASSAVYNNDEIIHTFLINDNIFSIDYYYLIEGEKIKLLFPDDAILYGVYKNEMILLLRSDWNTKGKLLMSGSLISLNIFENLNGKTNAKIIYTPNKKSSFVDIAVSKDFITVNKMVNVQNELTRFIYKNNEWISEKVNVTRNGSIRLISSDNQSNNVFFSYNNLITPTTLYNLNSSKISPLKTLKKKFDTDSLVLNQYYAQSKDGTLIPYFIVHKNNIKLNNNNPTIISAYGGFKVSLQPSYDKNVGIAWIERGGIYVIANIRGGGEYGPLWHTSAIKDKRQNAFDDLYAVSEDLISRKITSPKILGLIGGSNGGLLVGVAYTQRPELYNAIVCAVPLLDMKRFPKLLAGASWISEYGNPEIPEEWEYIKKYSPYHNIKKNMNYPEIFFITSTKDDRVHPGHARKMAMKLNELGYPYYYHEKIEGGHGSGSTNEQIADNVARIFTFFNTQLNKKKTALEILQKTINTIDTIETIYYKQYAMRTNPRNLNDTIYTNREMYFKRLIGDSIVGVKGHWYFYNDAKTKISFEDIYDSDKLIRKNNKDSTAIKYDLLKNPDFKKKHFWGHNTFYSMQYMYKQILQNSDFYKIEKLKDTIINNTDCHQIIISSENKGSALPGFKYKLIDMEGNVPIIILNIDKSNYFPIRVRLENYELKNPATRFFIDQLYFDLKYNFKINDKERFNTSDKTLKGFNTSEKTP